MRADVIQHAALAIEQADSLFVSAGAGMGVDSGLPDFRGDQGFWQAYPLLKQQGLSFIDLADPKWFEDDPKRAWGFYGHRFNLYQTTTPHSGFGTLLNWMRSKAVAGFVFTSNVDGHFQKAGFASAQVYECHGSIKHLQCSVPCCEDIWPAPADLVAIDEARLLAQGELPRCIHCGALARPNILMFGDDQWLHQRASHQYHRFEHWKREVTNCRVVTIELGAGTAIPSARFESDQMPGITIRINPREAEGNADTLSIAMPGLAALQAIEQALADL